jgi:hypothetical protein
LLQRVLKPDSTAGQCGDHVVISTAGSRTHQQRITAVHAATAGADRRLGSEYGPRHAAANWAANRIGVLPLLCLPGGRSRVELIHRGLSTGSEGLGTSPPAANGQPLTIGPIIIRLRWSQVPVPTSMLPERFWTGDSIAATTIQHPCLLCGEPSLSRLPVPFAAARYVHRMRRWNLALARPTTSLSPKFGADFRMFFILVVLKISVKKSVRSALYRHQSGSEHNCDDCRTSSHSREFNDCGDGNLAATLEVTIHTNRRLPPSRQLPISAGHFSPLFPAA